MPGLTGHLCIRLPRLTIVIPDSVGDLLEVPPLINKKPRTVCPGALIGSQETKKSSGGNTPIELEITDGINFPSTYTGNPSESGIPSGTCFTLTGIWNNQYHSPDVYFYCQHSANGMTYYKPGESGTHDGNNNFRINTGYKATYTTTKKAFVESICVEPDDGNDLSECGFGT